MRHPMFESRWILLLSALLLLASCSEGDHRYTEQPALLPEPVGLGSKLLLVESKTATAFLIDAATADARSLRAAVLPQPTLSVARLAHDDQALVLSSGVTGDSTSLQAPGGLTLVSSDGSTRAFPLGNNPFDLLVQQPTGRYAALLRSGESSQFLRNANEMALVDLEASSADEPGAVRLFTLQESPRAVFFSEEYLVEGEPHSLAVVLTDNAAAVFDLADTDALPILIQLNIDPTNPLHPQDVRFDPANGRFYIRSSGSDDIFSLRLVAREKAPERASFAISLDIVAAGHLPSDLQLFELDGVHYLLVIAEGNRTAVVVDVATSRTTALRLPQAFDHALIYYTQETPHALLWDEQSGALATLTLSLSSAALDRSLVQLPSLMDGVSQVLPFGDGTVAFMGFGQYVTLVNPEEASVTPYTSQETLQVGMLDQERALLWLAPRGQSRVAYLDLATGGTDEMLLDQSVELAALVPGAGRLAVVHDDALGHITFVDLDDPQRATSIGVRGFLVNGLFE